ncbi:MAG: hypothetical protein HUU49_02610 [Candidatus Buchananbacteria bacterium]|nr:hypothetical protein [Candidatus Buchananbacteria bacterium]
MFGKRGFFGFGRQDDNSGAGNNVEPCAICGVVHENPVTANEMKGMGMLPGLLGALLSGGLGGGIPGVDVETTTVMINPKTGEVKTLTRGSRLEEVDLSAFDPDVIRQLEEVANFDRLVDEKSSKASELRREVSLLERNLRRAETRLKHSLWGQVDGRYYGDDQLEIGREGEETVRISRRGDHICIVEGELGQQLMSQQDAIEQMSGTIRDKNREAETLEREAKHQPELARVMHEEATEALFNYLRQTGNRELMRQLMTDRAFLHVDETGKLGISAMVDINEQTDGVPEEIRDMMAVMQKHHPSGRALPPAVAKLLGLNTPELPPVSDELPVGPITSPDAISDEGAAAENNGKDVVPPGTFMADEPVLVAANEPPLGDPDGGKLGD